jgi:uncharacterized RDD family membrane protein YckC
MSLSTVAPADINAGGTPMTPIQELAERSVSGELLVRRAIGACIDFIVLFSILLAAEAVLGNELYQKTLWVWIGAQALYFVLAEGLLGRSVGKLIMGTVVVDSAGRAPGILRAAVRTVFAYRRGQSAFALPARRRRGRRVEATPASWRYAGENLCRARGRSESAKERPSASAYAAGRHSGPTDRRANQRWVASGAALDRRLDRHPGSPGDACHSVLHPRKGTV